MSETNFKLCPTGGRRFDGHWTDPEEKLPDEGEPVLLVIDDYFLGFGYFCCRRWELTVPPWDDRLTGEEKVPFWAEYPRLPHSG